MTSRPGLWMRAELRTTERRAPLVPEDAARLVEGGTAVTVEDSPHRVFAASEYAAAGCRIVDAGSWPAAGADQVVLGLKELPDRPATLRHQHIFFGHAYKSQPGATTLLRRFAAGGGVLLDLEYLVDSRGRRLAAFGYWAGYVGAALAVLHFRGRLPTPLTPWSRESLDALLDGPRPAVPPRALVIGALGRSGQGARDALAAAGIPPTCWDLAETRDLDRATLLGYDLLVNTVLSTRPVEPFLTAGDVERADRRLRVVCDVSCDVGSPCNVLPIYDAPTTWQAPVHRLYPGAPPLDLIAIDNLPSLVPREASVAFSRDVVPHLAEIGKDSPQWRRCRRAFHEACRASGIDPEVADG